jgi:hypothetical protein
MAERRSGRALVASATLACVTAAVAFAQPLPPPPDTSGVCPSLEEDGLLCSADLLSGDCDDFVGAADRLGALYRSQLAKLPDSEAALKATAWWGCGPDSFAGVRALLARIGSPRAQQVLSSEPYKSLAAPPPLSSAEPTAPPELQPDCENLEKPAERTACAGVWLETVRDEHRRALASCQPLVPPGLRDDFARDESSFEKALPGRCAAQAVGASTPAESAFLRSRCLATAIGERTEAMRQTYPDCAAGDRGR